jgi:hypothetical protein
MTHPFQHQRRSRACGDSQDAGLNDVELVAKG